MYWSIRRRNVRLRAHHVCPFTLQRCDCKSNATRALKCATYESTMRRCSALPVVQRSCRDGARSVGGAERDAHAASREIPQLDGQLPNTSVHFLTVHGRGTWQRFRGREPEGSTHGLDQSRRQLYSADRECCRALIGTERDLRRCVHEPPDGRRLSISSWTIATVRSDRAIPRCTFVASLA